MSDKNTGKGRGFGFVTFNDPAGIPRFTLHGGLTDVLVADHVVRGRHEIRGRVVSLFCPSLTFLMPCALRLT